MERVICAVHHMQCGGRYQALAERPQQDEIGQRGTCARAKCSARRVPGRPAGCRGKPKNTRPRTRAMPGVAEDPSSAKASDVMRPPKDFPPANRGSPDTASDAAMTAARTVAVRTAGGSGLFFRCCT